MKPALSGAMSNSQNVRFICACDGIIWPPAVQMRGLISIIQKLTVQLISFYLSVQISSWGLQQPALPPFRPPSKGPLVKMPQLNHTECQIGVVFSCSISVFGCLALRFPLFSTSLPLPEHKQRECRAAPPEAQYPVCDTQHSEANGGHGSLCKLCPGDDNWGKSHFKPSGKILPNPCLCQSLCNSFDLMIHIAEDITNALTSHGLWGKIFIVQHVLESYLEVLEPFHIYKNIQFSLEIRTHQEGCGKRGDLNSPTSVSQSDQL